MQPHIRASDADRDRVVADLRGHTGTGRLTLDEFDARTKAAYRARTIGDLAALTADLPSPGPPPPPPPTMPVPVEQVRRRTSSCWPCW